MKSLLLSFISLSLAWEWVNLGRPGNCPSEQKLPGLNIDFLNQPFYQIYRSDYGPNGYGECVRIEFKSQSNHYLDAAKYSGIPGRVYFIDYFSVDHHIHEGNWGRFTEIHEEGDVEGVMIDTDQETYFVNYYCTSDDGETKKDYIELYANSPDFDPSPYYQLAYDRGFSDDNITLTLQEESYCGDPHFRLN
jgi:hypothetical protein